MSRQSLLVTILLVMGLGLIYFSVIHEQQKSTEWFRFRTDVYNMREIAAEILKDTTNCTASVKASAATPPDLFSATPIKSLILGSKEFYRVGGEYDGLVRISEMLIRPYDAEKDHTPGHKFEIHFERMTSGIGESKYVRALDIYFDKTPSASFPNYNFRCSLTPPGAKSEGLVDMRVANLPCSDTPAVQSTDAVCPEGKRPISCGLEDPSVQIDEDRIMCQINLAKNSCTFTHHRIDTCDVAHGHCYCL